ncbi:Gfo/Idh/MocA family oxidoreductase [Patescibacteria group bacterium]|nr:Gfo/Idh/MocA family oxidoreductase [Patescibacteria group bacterium]
MEKIGFGIIGCGHIAPYHAKALSEINNARLIAVSDIIPNRAKQFAKLYSTRHYCRNESIFEDKEIDVLNICTPSNTHADIAINAMRAGKHVIIEKPMALTLADVNRLISTSLLTNRKMSIVLQNRFNPFISELHSLIENQKLGKLLIGNATIRWFRPQKYYENSWHGIKDMGGDIVMNQLIHYIDLLVWLLGKVEKVFCYSTTFLYDIAVNNTALALIWFKNGSIGSIEGSTITYPSNIEGSITVLGELGSIKIGGIGLNQYDFRNIKGEIKKEIKNNQDIDRTNQISVYGKGHFSIILDMINSIINDKEPSTNGYEAKESIKVCLSMIESSIRKKPVKIMN